MGAATFVVQTFIGSTLLDGLIRPVPTVSVSITHFVKSDTLSTVAFKFVWALTQRYIDTAYFIAHVLAVIFLVTLSAPMDALPIIALKLIRAAGGFDTALLVRLVFAVITPITLPAHVDTLPTVTVELQRRARLGFLDQVMSSTVVKPFIRAIFTVLIAIAGP